MINKQQTNKKSSLHTAMITVKKEKPDEGLEGTRAGAQGRLLESLGKGTVELKPDPGLR